MGLRNSKNAFLDIIGDLSEFIVFAHAMGRGEKPWNAANTAELQKRSEEIWEELKILGPNVAAYLRSKEP